MLAIPFVVLDCIRIIIFFFFSFFYFCWQCIGPVSFENQFEVPGNANLISLIHSRVKCALQMFHCKTFNHLLIYSSLNGMDFSVTLKNFIVNLICWRKGVEILL